MIYLRLCERLSPKLIIHHLQNWNLLDFIFLAILFSQRFIEINELEM